MVAFLSMEHAQPSRPGILTNPQSSLVVLHTDYAELLRRPGISASTHTHAWLFSFLRTTKSTTGILTNPHFYLVAFFLQNYRYQVFCLTNPCRIIEKARYFDQPTLVPSRSSSSQLQYTELQRPGMAPNVYRQRDTFSAKKFHVF